MNGLIALYRSMNRWALAAGLGAAMALGGAPMMASAQYDGGVAPAEGRRAHGPRRAHRGMAHFGRLARELGLSAAQQAQVRAVMQQAREQRRALRDQPPEQRRQARRELRRSVHGQIQAILTPEQREQARALRAQHRERRMARRLEHMRERLDLTPAQEARLRGMFTRAQAERQRIRQQTQDPAARREAMRALRQRTREAVRSVLTPEQQSQLEQRRRGPRR